MPELPGAHGQVVVEHVHMDRRRQRKRALIGGAPALLSLVFALGVLVYSSRAGSADPLTLYFEMAQAAVAKDDLASAELCFERAIDLGGNIERARFEFAQALAKAGKTQRAVQLMRVLAPKEVAGYGPAHRWFGLHLLPVAVYEKGKRRENCEVHLLRAVEASPADSMAHLGLVRLYLYQHEYSKAEPHVAKAWELGEMSDLQYLQYYANWISVLTDEPHLPRVLTDARRLARDLEQRSLRQLSKAIDNHPARMAAALARVVNRDLAEATRLLEAGNERWPSYARYRGALAHVYFLRALELGTGLDKRDERTELLAKAVKIWPKKISALRELVRASGRKNARAQKVLDGQVAKAHAGERGLYGALYLGQEDYDRALPLLEEAYGMLHDRDPGSGNNLALCLIQQRKPDARRAFEIVDNAVKRWPKILRLRDTRGRVLIQLKRWREALADLEQALPIVADRSGTLFGIADAYAGLGDRRMAEEYRRRARKFDRKKAVLMKRIDEGWRWADLGNK